MHQSLQVPQSTCSAACGDGQVHRVKGFHSCCFDCIDCLPGTYQRHEGDDFLVLKLLKKIHCKMEYDYQF